MKRYSILITFLLLIPAVFQAQNGCKVRLPLSINSYQPTIVPVITVDGKSLYLDRKKHPDNTAGVKDEDEIWLSSKLSDSLWTPAVRLDNTINTAESDVLFSITPDKTKWLIYGDYKPDGTKKPGFSITKRTNQYWEKPKPLNIKDFYNDSASFFANLSGDGKVLLTSLSRKDSKGGLDLYVSFFNPKDSSFSAPKNLGETINTSSVEGSPFLAYDNKTLYFSSGGHKGYGRIDLFMTKRLDDSWTNWSVPVNLGKKINTPLNETSIYLTALGDTAYIVSSDEDNKSEGVYRICLPDSLKPEPYAMLRAQIFGIENSIPGAFLKPAHFFMNNDADLNEVSFTTNPDSNFIYYPLLAGRQYNIFLSQENYEDFSFSVNTKSLSKSKFIDYSAVLTPKKGNELLETVYFDVNIDELNPNEKAKLSLIVNKVIDPPTIKILVVGHTDETGSDSDNFDLSVRRAKKTAEFLEVLGFSPKNIKTEGKGKTNPKSDDRNLNRRAEIFIIE